MNNSQEFLSKLITVEADIIEGFAKFQENFAKYSDVFFQIEFSEENSEVVNTYFSGLASLHAALGHLIESSKLVACIKGVELISHPWC